MTAQAAQSFALSFAPGETLEQHAFAFVAAGTSTPYDLVGWSWRFVMRAATSPAAGTPAALDLTDAAGALVVDRTNGRITFALSANATAAVAANTRYTAALAGTGPSGQRHYFFRGVVTTLDAVVPLTGDAVPAAAVQNVLGPCAVTVPLPDVLVGLDFSGLPAGAQAAAALPSAFAFARASLGHAVMDGADTVVLAGAADAADVPLVGRLAAGHARGVYLGAACANLLSNARDPSSFGGAFTVTDGAAGPDGVTAKRVQVASGALGPLCSFLGVTQGLTYTASAWYRSPTGAAGAAQLATGHTTYTTAQVALGGAWGRAAATHADTASQPAQVDVFVATGGNFGTSGGTGPAAQDALVSLMQLEQGAFPHQPVLAAGSGATTLAANAAARAASLGSVDASAAVDPSGRLGVELVFHPEGARGEYADTIRLLSGSADYVSLDPTTGLLTISIGGATNATTRALTWGRGDTLRVFLAAGGGLATVATYQQNDGTTGDLAPTGAALGGWTASGTLYLLSGGANYSASAFLVGANFYRTGKAPAWTSPAYWLPDFRAGTTGFRNSTGVGAARTGYYETASLAEVLVRFDGTQLDLELDSNIYAGFPNQACIAVRVPGVAGVGTAFATANATPQTVRVTVPGSGLRTAYLTNGMTAVGAPVIGTWLRQARAVDGTRLEVVPRAAAPAKLALVYGDSITVGQGDVATVPNYDGFAVVLRRTYAREVALAAYGRRSLLNDYAGGHFAALTAYLAALAGECATAAGVTVVWAGDTNSFGDAAWGSTAAYESAATTFLTELRAALPSARILVSTMMPRTDKASFGVWASQAAFRTSQTTAYTAAALANAALLDGTAIPSFALSGDNLHPSTAGHAAIAAWLDGLLP